MPPFADPSRPLTCSTRPERGSTTRSFLSLQEVASRLPSVLKDMHRMTSVWQSIILTGSPMSKFQMRTCGGGEAVFWAILKFIWVLKPLAHCFQSPQPIFMGSPLVQNQRLQEGARHGAWLHFGHQELFACGSLGSPCSHSRR